MADPLYMSQRPQNSLGLNINDVIEVIGEDLANSSHQNVLYGDNNNVAASEADFSTASTATTTVDPMSHVKEKAQVHIIEQPQAKALRFRYICEGRSAGSIPGVRSTAENKTFPAIKVVGYTGPAVVVVSCVTVDPPYRPHPHNLVGKDGCRKGVCTVNFNNENMECVFSNLGIQCVKKRDVEDALKQRDSIRVDPFQTGFAHRNQPQSIDLNSLRLCFQVFLEGPQKGKFTHPLKPVVSDPIYDKKATCDLLISKLSDCTSTVAGGKEVILLCDKVTKEDILVRFYEVKDGRITWEAYGDFQPSDVHKQVAISFKTPRYEKLEIENPVKVYVQLQRPSDKATSEPRQFEYLPLDSDPDYVKRKIARSGNTNNTQNISRFLMENMPPNMLGAMKQHSPTKGEEVKMEPPDRSPLSPPSGRPILTPSPHWGAGATVKSTISPQSVPSPSSFQPPSPQGYFMSPATPNPPVVTSTLCFNPLNAGSSASYSMVVGGGAGGRVTVTSPVLTSTNPTHHQPDPHQPSILDLDSLQYVDSHERLHAQHPLVQGKQNIFANNNNSLSGLLNSAEMPSDSYMRNVLSHISDNSLPNLSIIDNPPLGGEIDAPMLSENALGPVNHLNAAGSSSGCSNQPFLPNILTSGGDNNSKATAPSNMCDSLNTPTPSGDNISQHRSDMEMINNSMR